MRFIACFVLIYLNLVGSALAAQTYGRHVERAVPASISTILASPQRLNGKVVGVYGVLKAGRGLGLLFFSREHASWNDLANAVEVIPDSRVLLFNTGDSRWAALNGQAVYLEGRLSATFVEDDDKTVASISVTFVQTMNSGNQ
ncbi:MAG: hypothetical protein ABSG50_09310 [Opitutaceae bacterium]|jgi:hypothetical protein